MKKLCYLLIPICLLCLLAAAFLSQDSLPGWEVPEILSAAQQVKIEKELSQAVSCCLGLRDADAMEARLLEEGFATVDSDALYPSYLGNPESLYTFWDSVSTGRNAELTVLRVNEDGGLSHLFFVHGKEQDFYVATMVKWDSSGSISVQECSVLPIYEMELADWGIFYYRLYLANDPHYVDYAQFRLESVDRGMYDLTRKYILPVGYQLVNLFLCDWQEGSWGQLSFSDLLDPLYTLETGKVLTTDPYPMLQSPSRAMIPAELFEKTILPYFQISPEEFRTLCRYDPESDAYPWRPIFGEDITGWKYPMCEPEVIRCSENADGTLTLEVQVYSPELKTNRLFVHEITVRPLESGDFQYVSNHITYVSDRGLPPAMARFELDGGWE